MPLELPLLASRTSEGKTLSRICTMGTPAWAHCCTCRV